MTAALTRTPRSRRHNRSLQMPQQRLRSYAVRNIHLMIEEKKYQTGTSAGRMGNKRKTRSSEPPIYRLPNSIPPPAEPPGPSTPGLAKLTLKNKSSPLLEGVNLGSQSGLLSTTSRSVRRIFGPALAISGVRGRSYSGSGGP